MWNAFPLIAALAVAPAQPAGGALSVTNVRFTFGELGGTRPGAAFLPGDAVFLAFSIEGIAPQADGRLEYLLGMEITDKAGKSVEKPEQARKVDFLPLGGARVPASAFYALKPDHVPGEYVFKVTVVDPATKTAKTAEKAFTVRPKEFGIVRVYPSTDPLGQAYAPTTGVVGQTYFLHCAVVGFARDAARMSQPNLLVEMTPLDDRGRPTIQKPYALTFDAGVPADGAWVFIRFQLPLWREGKFTVRLKATDQITKTTTTFDLPIAVVPHGN